MAQSRQPGDVSEDSQFTGGQRQEPTVPLQPPEQWPAIDFEERPWTADPDAASSRRQRLLARGPYLAAVVPPIATIDPVLNSRTQALAEQAVIEMARFDRDMGEDAAPFATLLLRSESAASSEIEKLTAGSRKIALARIGDTTSENARMIASNVAAMNAALDLAEDLSVDNIAAMHRALMAESEPDMAGQYRQSQVWIRGNSPHNADFVPPHHERLDESLADLADFMRRDDLPALTQAAIAHAQFETIHPFADGNGRTGRAIVSSLLRNKNVTEKVTIPVSSGLLVNTATYFDALTEYRDGRIQPIVELFAESSFAAMDNGRQLAADIRGIQEGFVERLGGTRRETVTRTVELLAREPAVTAGMLTALAGVSDSAAYRALEELEEAGILNPSGKVKGIRVWVAPDIIAALDAFAVRGGRRQRG